MSDNPKKCPQGSCKYSSPPTRIRITENMISKANINLNCQNSGEGCLVEEKRDILNKHAPECLSRMVMCPEVSCQKKLILSKLDEHFSENKENHGINESFENSTLWIEEHNIVGTDDIYWETRFITVEDCRFWRVFAKRSNLWYTWVVGELSIKQAAQWNFSVKAEKNGMSLETRGNVSPIDFSVDKILNSGCYMSLTTATLKKLMEKKQEGDSYKWWLFLKYTLEKS